MVKEKLASKNNQNQGDIITVEEINKNNEGDQKNISDEFTKQKEKFIWAIPLERLYEIHRDIIVYHEKYKDFGDKINGLLGTTLAENLYTGVQYLNRVASVVNGILLLTEKFDTNQGGIFTIVSSGVELTLSYSKDKLFNVEEKKKIMRF